MNRSKPICSLFANYFKISYKQYFSSDEEKNEMKRYLIHSQLVD